MYKCDNCGKITSTKEKQNKVEVVREREYTNVRHTFDPKTRKSNKEYFTTTGHENAGELNFCNECFEKHNGDVKDGENTQRERRGNQTIKGRSAPIKKRGEISGSGYQRIG